jgi:Na+-driven multidrug efflux pump
LSGPTQRTAIEADRGLLLLALWAVQVPLAYVMSRSFGMGADGIWVPLVLGSGVQLALMWFRFRQGRWRNKVI